MVNGPLPAAARSPFWAPRSVPALLAFTVLLVVAAACGTAGELDGPVFPATEAAEDRGASVTGVDSDDAARRAVVVATTGCGSAPASEGSGVALSPTTVLTAAHVVAGSTEITVRLRGDDPIVHPLADGGQATTDGERQPPLLSVDAVVVAYDTARDLALLELGGAGLAAPTGGVPLGDLATGDDGVIAGAGVSGDIAFTVTERTTIVIDEVRGTDRVRRSGYILAATTRPGDSGSGLYDDEGRLVGVLFAVSTEDEGRSWATAGSEIEAFLDDVQVAGSFACDVDRSRLAPVG